METKKFNIDLKKIGIGAAKIIIGGAASIGAGYIITRYGKKAIKPDEKLVTKVLMLIGAGAISGAVGEVAGSYVEKQIDSVVKIGETVNNTVDKLFNEEEQDGGSEDSEE